MACPYLDYRTESNDQTFDHERPYCTVAEEFVQPMRADICNGRYGLIHDRDCEIYIAHEGIEILPDGGSNPNSMTGDTL